MTEAEITRVVDSAKATAKLMEESDAKQRALGNVPLGTILELRAESGPKVAQAFDEAGAERFLAEHPNHAQASFVREVMGRLAAGGLVLRWMTAVVKFDAQYESLTEGSPTWFIDMDAALEAKINDLRAVDRDVTALLAREVLETNRKRLLGISNAIKKTIAESEKSRSDAAPDVARQRDLQVSGQAGRPSRSEE